MNLSKIDMLQFEKHKAMIRYQNLHKLAKLARSLELLFAMALFSWSIARLFPAIADLFAASLRWLCKIAVNQHFVFLLGNLIVVALLVKSGRSGQINNRIDDEESLIRQFLPPPAKLEEFEADEFELEETGRGNEWSEEEDLSDEEFQRKVEAFIERQQRFLREESLSMAVRNRS